MQLSDRTRRGGCRLLRLFFAGVAVFQHVSRMSLLRIYTAAVFPLIAALFVATAAGGELPVRGGAQHVASRSCPITRPNGTLPRELEPDFQGNHGNGKLWVYLSEGKLMIEPRTDGTLRWKFGWWTSAPGQLTIRGRRLDAAGKPLKSDVSSPPGMPRFHPSTVIFPTPGCWQITGRANGSELTFVVEVESVSKDR
jgi:hypothetical protein